MESTTMGERIDTQNHSKAERHSGGWGGRSASERQLQPASPDLLDDDIDAATQEREMREHEIAYAKARLGAYLECDGLQRFVPPWRLHVAGELSVYAAELDDERPVRGIPEREVQTYVPEMRPGSGRRERA